MRRAIFPPQVPFEAISERNSDIKRGWVMMDSVSESNRGEAPIHQLTLPNELSDGHSILIIAPFEPSECAIPLRLLSQYGQSEDMAPVVTTLASAEKTIETWNSIAADDTRPSIGIIDTTSTQQSIAAAYGDLPIYYTPSSGDLERVVMALADLAGETPPASGNRHLVFRSLTPIIQKAPMERVCHVLERIIGLRVGTGLGLFGIDGTAHDQVTLSKIADTVDDVVWFNRTSDDELTSTYHPNRQHVPF